MFFDKNSKRQLVLIGVIAVLLFIIIWCSLNSNSARFAKPIDTPNPTNKIVGEVNIYKLLHRFSGSDKKADTYIDNLLKDSSNRTDIDSLKAFGIKNQINIFIAYALYLDGINKKSNSILLESAKLFFEAGSRDPDTLADKTTYRIYTSRACDRILKTEPNNLAALTYKGTSIVYFGGPIMEGVGLLKAAESIDSNYIEAQHQLMILDLQSGQYKKAEKRLKKLLHLQPDNQQYADLLLKIKLQNLK